MTKRIVIVGCGGMGREVYGLLSQDVHYADHDFVAIDDTFPPEDSPLRTLHISSIASYIPAEFDYLLCCIASPNTREKICNDLRERGAKFLTYKHSSALIVDDAKIGQGSILYPNTFISTNVVVGEFVILNINTTIGHDASIGSYSTLSGHCDLTGNVHVGRRVFMGTSACVIPNIKIADDATIGAGSVVVRNIRSNTTVFGNPAKKIS